MNWLIIKVNLIHAKRFKKSKIKYKSFSSAFPLNIFWSGDWTRLNYGKRAKRGMQWIKASEEQNLKIPENSSLWVPVADLDHRDLLSVS